ncbi:MAG: phosphoribosylformylglycinamidine synthase subunit PurQ [Ignavibacteria bacterium]|nr:phosphoribosylformylglycinamidine synthase subunit PurQ [Ignavibacteria bacterium]
MNVGVVTFPGSNCDADARHAAALANADNGDVVHQLWHKDSVIPQGLDAIILPGGFSYGDYLRTGAIARFSPIMKEVIAFANNGGVVLGICNGFQILCESGLLPGALIRNENLKFVCKDVFLKVENTNTPFTNTVKKGSVLRMPVAHGDGRYTASEAEIILLEKNKQIVYRYVSQTGEKNAEANPNGSMHNIAGICNKDGNVMGLMPHPERASEALLGSADGFTVFTGLLAHFQRKQAQVVA